MASLIAWEPPAAVKVTTIPSIPVRSGEDASMSSALTEPSAQRTKSAHRPPTHAGSSGRGEQVLDARRGDLELSRVSRSTMLRPSQSWGSQPRAP